MPMHSFYLLQAVPYRRYTRYLWLCIGLLLAWPQCGKTWDAYPEDPFGLMPDHTRMTEAPSTEHCANTAFSTPLLLSEAIDQALCHHPQTKADWAAMKAQAAQVGTAYASYLPTVSASVQGARDFATTRTPVFPSLDTNHSYNYQTQSLTINWVLYDFGARDAALRNAKQLLIAAQANYGNTLHKIFATTVKDYYTASAAQSALGVALENEGSAHQVLEVTETKVLHGIVAVSDKLQAQTAYSQAVIARIKAEGTLKNALGTLSVDMGTGVGKVTQVLPVPDIPANDQPVSATLQALIAEAERQHPSLSVASAQLEAAIAKSDQVRAQGRPSLSFTARSSRNTQPESLGTGLPTTPARSHDNYLGLQLDIPIFEGFVRTYQIRNAEAQVEAQRANLEDAIAQVDKDVWTSYQDFKTSQENILATQNLLDNAQLSFTASKERYQKGVADIQELLSVQAALANARQQHMQSIADLQTARNMLEVAVGKMSF